MKKFNLFLKQHLVYRLGCLFLQKPFLNKRISMKGKERSFYHKLLSECAFSADFTVNRFQFPNKEQNKLKWNKKRTVQKVKQHTEIHSTNITTNNCDSTFYSQCLCCQSTGSGTKREKRCHTGNDDGGIASLISVYAFLRPLICLCASSLCTGMPYIYTAHNRIANCVCLLLLHPSSSTSFLQRTRSTPKFFTKPSI